MIFQKIERSPLKDYFLWHTYTIITEYAQQCTDINMDERIKFTHKQNAYDSFL